MKQYFVWAEFESRVDADVIKAASLLEAAQDWAQQRNFPMGDENEGHDIVTVLEDVAGAIEESYDVFCKVTYTAIKRAQA